MSEHPVPQEPTSEQCNARVKVCEHNPGTPDGLVGYAMWFPQLGGYHGKCVVVFCEQMREDLQGCCCDVYVWHDGRFPFTGDGRWGDGPARLHLCDPSQFIRFGESIIALMDARPESDKAREKGK